MYTSLDAWITREVVDGFVTNFVLDFSSLAPDASPFSDRSNLSRSSGRFGSANSLSSVVSSASTMRRKKHAAPPPPPPPPPPVAVNSSTSFSPRTPGLSPSTVSVPSSPTLSSVSSPIIQTGSEIRPTLKSNHRLFCVSGPINFRKVPQIAAGPQTSWNLPRGLPRSPESEHVEPQHPLPAPASGLVHPEVNDTRR